MKNSKTFTFLVLIALLCLSTFGNGQVIKHEIVLGNTISLESEVLNEERDFYVYLPTGYEQSDEKYPVMYVLDGETKFTISAAIANFLANNRQIPQMIVVGIPNVARNRDFTPTVSKQMNVSGGADNFVGFLDNELTTFIDTAYRTHDYQILFGHSLCGMFSVYTLFAYPDLFDAYIAASPYLMYDDEFVVKKAKDALNSHSDFTNQIYMSIGDEPTYFNSLENLKSVLKNTSGINWILQKYEDEDHRSIPFRTIADGLEYIFSDWQLTNDIAMKGVDAIKGRIKYQEDKYGFSNKNTEASINIVGYQLLQADKFKKAIEIFQKNAELYPKSANVYDSLGDAYDAKGNKKKALFNYKKAVSIAEATNNPNLSVFKDHQKRLEE
jgi:predicted alpha/beta superfamily hydrolase